MDSGYYQYLKSDVERISNTSNDIVFDFIKYIPDFFRVLTGLLDEDMPSEDRRAINCAIAYFVVDNDIIPEGVYGAYGYVDDVFICTHVLKIMYKNYPDAVLKLWDNNESFEYVLNKAYSDSTHILEQRDLKDKILVFAGLN